MMMVECGGFDERPALRAMFRARKEVFVDLLKWDVPVLADEFEIDQFDDEHARYVIVADEQGAHLASARLLETTRPHILGSLFPQLCAGDVPRGSHVLEITRFCLDRNQNASTRRSARNRLITALVAMALARGTRSYSGVAEMAWLQQILAFGWDCRPLGIPQEVGGRLLGALHISITAQTPQLLEETGIWTPDPFGRSRLAQAA
jgi:N-acyl-L-homoserine lactone synthetase